jgi:uncharacterized damage-inducible protein DinB
VAQSSVSSKQRFHDVYARESATTLKVLKAYPADKAELRPHAKCKTARELAWMFVIEQGMCTTAMTTGFDWSKPMDMPPPPDSLAEVIAAFEAGVTKLLAAVDGLSEEQLGSAVQFPTAPKTIGDMPLLDFLWFALHDQIHHRGQLSVYLRMADGKLPSIYGPTADEPWS